MDRRENYVVIVGETGSGKSTFINYAANYFLKGSLLKPYIAIPTTHRRANMNFGHNENSVEDKTKSKTVDCQCYTFYLDQVKFHFIDTPGVNDTGGFTQDMQNVDKVFSYIERIPKLNALILILNGAVARITVNIKNVLSIYRDRLPDAIYSNIIIILTNCEEHTVNFSPKYVDLSERCSVFHMQNSAFSSDPTRWSHHTVNILQQDFDSSMKTMNDIVHKLLALQPASTKLFKDLSDDRNRIKQKLQMARMTIFDLQNLEDELAAYEISADIHAANAEKFSNFIQNRKVVRNQRFETNYHNTICIKCNTTCHENCLLNETYVPGSHTLRQCSSIGRYGRCTKCPNKCDASTHVHERYIFRRAEVTVAAAVESMQQQYLQARNGKREAVLKCENLQTSRKMLERELDLQYKEVKESIENLQETLRDANITAILFQFIELLEKDASTLKSYSVIQKSRKFIDSIKSLCSTSKQSPETQLAVRLQPSENTVWQKPVPQKIIENVETLQRSDETRMSDMSNLPTTNGSSPPEALYPTLSSAVNDSNMDVDHDVQPLSVNMANHGQTTMTEDSEREKLPKEQDMTDQVLNPKRELGKENIAMLPSEDLLRIVNSDANDLNKDDIKAELQRRCNGESIGFLTFAEQITLCDEYVKYHQMNLRDLMRLSLKLTDENNVATHDDPLKINLIPRNKLLQVSAINLLIRNKR